MSDQGQMQVNMWCLAGWLLKADKRENIVLLFFYTIANVVLHGGFKSEM